MILDLDREDLLSLLKGTSPYYDAMDEVTIQTCGYYNDNSGWHWIDSMLKELPDEGLYRLYMICKLSWKKGALDSK